MAARRRRKDRGTTGLIVLAGFALLLTLMLSLAGSAMTAVQRARNEQRAVVAFQAAQATLELETAAAYDRLGPARGQFTYFFADHSAEIAPLAPGVTATATVRPLNDVGSAWITAIATVGGRVRSLRALVLARDVSIWNNAIFGGTGASGRSINGKVDIRGSVHLLGEGEAYSDLNGNGRWDPAEAFTDRNRNGVWDPGEPFVDANGDGVWNSAEPYNDTNGNGIYDPPITTTDLASTLGGTAYVGNNYSGMPLDLRALVPTAPRISGIETLNAEFRVKRGQVSVNGSATIGAGSLIDGGFSKNTLDGVFVNDGFVGNKGAESVFSDNGTSNSYDLDGLGITFPLLSGIGAQPYFAEDGTTWPDHETYLNARSVTIPVTSITGSTAGFTYNDGNGNSITYTPPVKDGNKIVEPGNVHVTGIIKIGGNLQIGNSKETITYTGNGTIFSTGDISISSNFLPKAGHTFPTTARVGLIAKRNMNLATGNGDAQLSMAGAFYAQGTVRSAKQNQIAGTFVANHFDMGTNVPKIYQVPSLVQNMPPSMPGDKMMLSLRVRSWRERGRGVATDQMVSVSGNQTQ